MFPNYSLCSVGTVFSETEGKPEANFGSPFDTPQRAMQAFHAHIYYLDALKKYMGTEWSDVLGFIRTIMGCVFDNLHLLVTSQKQPEIECHHDSQILELQSTQSWDDIYLSRHSDLYSNHAGRRRKLWTLEGQ